MAKFMLQYVCLSLLVATSAQAMRGKRSGRRVLPQQPEDDVSQCLGDFQVSQSTIIRTDDSRSMGAKYLNETEMPTKEDCIKWCCETSKCNVAVYEEKNKGSCYTFDCSPTGDFKCRFTTHEHYTSAVLKIRAHDSDKWANKNKHAEELIRLKDEEPTVKTAFVSTTTSPTTMVIQQTGVGPTQIAATSFVSSFPAGEKASDERRCSRFQFECRNTSECIAIYNACDGIPQCSDASDESVELGCPQDSPRKTLGGQLSEYQLKNVHAEDQAGDQIPADQQRGVQTNSNYNDYVASELQHQHQDQFQQPQHFNGKNNNNFPNTAFTHKSSGLLQNNYEAQLNSNRQRPMQQNHRGYVKSYAEGNAEDLPDMTRETYPNQMPINRAPVNPYFDQDYDTWSRNKNNFNAYNRPAISGNHQEGRTAQTYSHGVYDGNGQPAQYYKSQGKEYSNRDGYQEMPEKKPVLKNAKSDHFEGFANNKESWTDDQQKQTQEDRQYKEHIFSTDMQMNPLDTKNMQTKPDDGSNLKVKPQQQSLSTAATTLQTEAITTERSKAKPTNKQETLPHPQPNKVQVNLAEVEIQNLDHANGTNGAAVALTFGLTLTGMLVVLVGCRLRVVRRHLWRGRSPFTHDADYLVNGMYL